MSATKGFATAFSSKRARALSYWYQIPEGELRQLFPGSHAGQVSDESSHRKRGPAWCTADNCTVHDSKYLIVAPVWKTRRSEGKRVRLMVGLLTAVVVLLSFTVSVAFLMSRDGKIGVD